MRDLTKRIILYGAGITSLATTYGLFMKDHPVLTDPITPPRQEVRIRREIQKHSKIRTISRTVNSIYTATSGTQKRGYDITTAF